MKTIFLSLIATIALLFTACDGDSKNNNNGTNTHDANLISGLVGMTLSNSPNYPPLKVFIGLGTTVVQVEDLTGEPLIDEVPGVLDTKNNSESQCETFSSMGLDCEWSAQTQQCDCKCPVGGDCERVTVGGVGTVLIDPIIIDDLAKLMADAKVIQTIKDTYGVELVTYVP